MEFSRKEYWSGLPFLSPGDLPKPGIEAWSPALQANSLPTGLGGKPYLTHILFITKYISSKIMCVGFEITNVKISVCLQTAN